MTFFFDNRVSEVDNYTFVATLCKAGEIPEKLNNIQKDIYRYDLTLNYCSGDISKFQMYGVLNCWEVYERLHKGDVFDFSGFSYIETNLFDESDSADFGDEE